jgi:hypothetical protein
MLIEKYGPKGLLISDFSVAAVGDDFGVDHEPFVVSCDIFSASASLDGRRRENDIRGSGCKAMEENDDSVAP